MTDERLMDVLEGRGLPPDREHAAACDACTERLAAVAEGLTLAECAEVPEPAPFFWASFRASVSRRIAEDPKRRPQFVAPALLAAAAVLAMAVVTPRLLENGSSGAGASAPVTATLPAWSPLPAEDDEPGLSVIEALDPAPVELARAGGCTDLAGCMAGLTDEESASLAELVRVEFKGGQEL